MRTFFVGCLSIILVLMASIAKAEVPATLYSDTVPVVDQSDTARNIAFRAALADVLIKTSANPAVTSQPAIIAALKQAPLWVQSYQYANQANQLQLLVQFDPNQINQLLTSAKQTLWSATRPQTLIWVGLAQQGQQQLIGTNSTSSLLPLIQTQAANLGLPLVFPLIDLQDVATVNFNTLANYQPDTLRLASARYPHDDVLVLTITAPADATKGNWQANWTVLQNGAKTNWQSTAHSEAELVKQGMQQFAALIFKQAATQVTNAANNPSNIALTVYGVKSLQDYSKVNAYLQSLSAISSLSTATMASDHVVFQLSLNTSSQAFNQFLASSALLTAAPGNENNNLIYQVKT